MNRNDMLARLSEISDELDAMDADALTDDDEARQDELLTEADGLRSKVEQIEARDAKRKSIRDVVSRAEGSPGDDRGAPATVNRDDPFSYEGVLHGPDVRARALSAIEAVPHLEDRAKEQATRLVERIDNARGDLSRHLIVTGRTAYRTGFQKVLAGRQELLDDQERRALSEARALSSVDAGGGYAVPFTLDPTVIQGADGTSNPFRQISRTATTLTDSWNGVRSGGVTARWATEGAQAQDDAATYSQPSVDVHRAEAFVPYSFEIGQDWAGIEQEMALEFAFARDDIEATAFAVGSGSGQPQGIVTGLGGDQTVDTAGAFSVGNLYALRAAVPPRFRQNASWVAELNIYQTVRQFDANGGADLWVQLGGSEPNQLIGHDAYESSAMESDPTESDGFLAVLGDFARGFLIVDRIGMVVENVPHTFGGDGRPKGERGWFAHWRVGSDVIVPNAFRRLKVTSS